jgi:ABC-type phosphate transport system ATPase subunit
VVWLLDFTDKMAKLRVTRSGELFLNDERVSFDTLEVELDQIRNASGVEFCEYEEPAFAKCPMTRAVCDEIKKKTTDKSGSFQQITERRYKDAQLLDERKDRR